MSIVPGRENILEAQSVPHLPQGQPIEETNRSPVYYSQKIFSWFQLYNDFGIGIRLLLLHQAGIIDHAMQKFASESNNNPCSINPKYVQKNVENQQGSNSSAFKLKYFSGAFVVLGVGLALALLAFVGEIIIVAKNSRGFII